MPGLENQVTVYGQEKEKIAADHPRRSRRRKKGRKKNHINPAERKNFENIFSQEKPRRCSPTKRRRGKKKGELGNQKKKEETTRLQQPGRKKKKKRTMTTPARNDRRKGRVWY